MLLSLITSHLRLFRKSGTTDRIADESFVGAEKLSKTHIELHLQFTSIDSGNRPRVFLYQQIIPNGQFRFTLPANP